MFLALNVRSPFLNRKGSAMELPDTSSIQIPPYITPANLPGRPRSGGRYRTYSEDDMSRAEQAVTEQGLSLRQASVRFNVPKTTLAERLGDRRPKPPPRKSDEENKLRTRYQWSETDMASAVEAVHNGDKVSDAARRFGVPSSHLNARTRGRAPKNLRSELSRLTLRQEGLLAEWAAAQCALGCPPTKNELFNLADRVLKKQGSDKKLGKQWIVHWMRRYPQIEILEWEPQESREPKTKKGQKTDPTVAFFYEHV